MAVGFPYAHTILISHLPHPFRPPVHVPIFLPIIHLPPLHPGKDGTLHLSAGKTVRLEFLKRNHFIFLFFGFAQVILNILYRNGSMLVRLYIFSNRDIDFIRISLPTNCPPPSPLLEVVVILIYRPCYYLFYKKIKKKRKKNKKTNQKNRKVNSKFWQSLRKKNHAHHTHRENTPHLF